MANRKAKDFRGFVKQDSKWLDQSPRNEQDKIVIPAYSHVYMQKVPSQPLNSLIYKKI